MILRILTFISFCLIICSCGKEFSDDVVGTWILSTYEIADCPGDDIEEGVRDADEDGCVMIEAGFSLCYTLVFNSDSTAVITVTEDGEADSNPFTYSVDNEAETIEVCVGSNCDVLTKDGDLLSGMDQEDGCEVTLLFEKQ